MQMRITIGSIGASAPRTGFGVNGASGAYIQFREDANDTPYILGLGDYLSLGSKNGTLAMTLLWTEWFAVGVSHHPWLHRKSRLTGQRATLTVEGTTLIVGEVKVIFIVYDDRGHPRSLMERAFVESSGFQAASTTVTGVLCRMSEQHIHQPEKMEPPAIEGPND